MALHWYFQVMGEEQGPVNSSDLKRLAAIGNIERDTLIRRGKDGRWVTADQVQGLFEVIPPPVPPTAVAAPPVQAAAATNGAPHMVRQAKPSPVAKYLRRRPASRSVWQKLWVFLDPMFERYLTPWIIRVTWVVLLIVAVIGAAMIGYGHVVELGSLRPDEFPVQEAESELAAAESILAVIEESRGVRRRPPPVRTESPPPERYVEDRGPPRDILADAKQRVLQAKAELDRAKASVPSRWQLLGRHFPLRALLYLLELTAGILAILWLRVVLEAAIVLFQIVAKLGSIESRLEAIGKQEPPTAA